MSALINPDCCAGCAEDAAAVQALLAPARDSGLSILDLATILRTALAHDRTPSQVLADMPHAGAIAPDGVSHVGAPDFHSPATFTVRSADGTVLFVTIRSDRP